MLLPRSSKLCGRTECPKGRRARWWLRRTFCEEQTKKLLFKFAPVDYLFLRSFIPWVYLRFCRIEEVQRSLILLLVGIIGFSGLPLTTRPGWTSWEATRSIAPSRKLPKMLCVSPTTMWAYGTTTKKIPTDSIRRRLMSGLQQCLNQNHQYFYLVPEVLLDVILWIDSVLMAGLSHASILRKAK